MKGKVKIIFDSRGSREGAGGFDDTPIAPGRVHTQKMHQD